MMKNAFYFFLNVLFVLKILKFELWSFLPLDFLVIESKRLDQKDKVNFKIFDVTTWLTNNYNTHIAQYLTK